MLRKMNFNVFPVQKNGKYPAFRDDWATHTTNEPEKIESWLKSGYNLGVNCGVAGLCVIDIDNKGTKRGGEMLDRLQQKYGELPRTYTVKTPSGGLHYYFKGATCNRIDMLKGIDVRSVNGYVLSEGSVINDREYIAVDISPIQELPEWLRLQIGKPKERNTESSIVIQDIDNPDNVNRAVKFVSETAQPAIEGDGGDHQTFKTIAKVRDMGISQEMCYDIISQCYNPRCEPEWSEVELERKIQNAYSYSRNPLGVDTQEFRQERAKEVFEPLKEKISIIPLSSKLTPIQDIPKREWILGHRLIRKYISLIVAPGGVGKSTFSMLDALSIASGIDLTGDKVIRSGPVWLHNAEDPMDELQMRLYAAAKFHNIDLGSIKPIYLTSGRNLDIGLVSSHNGHILINDTGIDLIINTICHNDIMTVIFDPLIEIHDADENSNREMKLVCRQLTKISESTGCGVEIIHHSGKRKNSNGAGDSDSSRGASAIVSAARIATTLSTMSEKEAEKFSVTEEKRPWFVRLDDAKVNLAPPAEHTRWFERVSVELENGESVGTLKPVKLERIQEGSVFFDYLDKITEHYPIGNHKLKDVLEEVCDLVDDDREIRTVTQWFKRQMGPYKKKGVDINNRNVFMLKSGVWEIIIQGE